MSAVQLSHDGFARTFFMRERVKIYGTEVGCAFCGRVKTTLYRYYHRAEDSTRPPIQTRPRDLFCSVSCYRSYNG